MAKYPANRVLRKATPTIDIATEWVKSWSIDVMFTHTREDNSTWSKTYSHVEKDLEFLQKKPQQFTADELINFLPSNMDVVFDAHYEAHNSVQTDETLSDFPLNSLSLY